MNKEETEHIFDYETRLVRFVANCVRFFDAKNDKYEIQYYKNQLIRSSGSAALNYGEAQGTITSKDFVHKTSIVCKELKESRTSFRILEELGFNGRVNTAEMLTEVEQLIAISSKMIMNKRSKLTTVKN